MAHTVESSSSHGKLKPYRGDFSETLIQEKNTATHNDNRQPQTTTASKQSFTSPVLESVAMKTSRGQENTQNVYKWREEEEPSPSGVKKGASPGLPPRAFHRAAVKPGQEKVDEIKTTSNRRLLVDRKRQIGQEQELRLAAFREVTTLKTWHTQEQAFRHFAQLQRDYLGLPQDPSLDNDIQSGKGEKGTQKLATQESSSSSSSAQSSSATSLASQEPKRQLVGRHHSPAKSTRKHQYREEFLREQSQQRPLPVDASCVNAMWSMEPRIWSIERSSTGKRKYVVGQTGRLMDRYWRRVDREHRHYYELIPAGQACRLYLDLEFSKVTNPEIDCEEDILAELLTDLSEELQLVYPDQVKRPLERSDIVDLDSTTDTKFSRHWIVHLPSGNLFRDTAALGRFVQGWIGRLADLHATKTLGDTRPLLEKSLFVNPPPSTAASPIDRRPCIVDMGVYTRNRLFRLMGSSKFGKPTAAALRIAESNCLPFPLGFGNHLFYSPDMAPSPKSQETGGDDAVEIAVESFKSSTDWTDHAEALAQTLVVPLNACKMDFPILPHEEEPIAQQTRETLYRSSGPKMFPSQSMNTGHSPYPMIDNFVTKTLATRGGVQGSIRAWSIDTNEDDKPVSLTYHMSRNRWCECVQRAHKSNNVYWMVDLILWQCVQRCHDPECHAMKFRGAPVALPSTVRDAVQDQWLDEELANIDESELIKASSAQGNSDESRQLQRQDFDFDVDEEFEAALMALNLGPATVEREVTKSSGPELPATGCEETGQDDAALASVTNPFDGLTENDLIKAMADNPELFP
jgi:hypothetical protein